MDKNSILLPAKFRKIGILLIISSVVLAFIFKPVQTSLEFPKEVSSLVYHVLFGLINVGLFAIFYAKRSTDDEMTTQMKLKATMLSVLSVTLMFIIKPIIDTIFGDPITLTAGFTIIMLQSLQILMYYQMKRKLIQQH